MLQIIVPEVEKYDEKTNRFVYSKSQTLRLEHSLVSISKWESKFCKPFLHTNRNEEETIYYIKCMTLTQNVPDEVYYNLSADNIQSIAEYIDSPMTATVVRQKGNNKPSRELITSELIYYWMVTYNIPSEYQKWHLNRLLTLIQVCSAKNDTRKMDPKMAAKERADLNRMRRAKMHSKG